MRVKARGKEGLRQQEKGEIIEEEEIGKVKEEHEKRRGRKKTRRGEWLVNKRIENRT